MPEAAASLDTIVCEAVEIADPAARLAYLDGACGPDPAVRRRAAALVAAHFRAGGAFLEPPVVDPDSTAGFVPVTADLPGPGAGTVIGPYALREQIGEGGMGLVFVAEQTEPVRRKVALKVIKPGMDTRQVVARFEAERQALALMDHPNIARVFDAGATPEGRPYFVMELVKGEPATDYCDHNRLALRDRLGLFLQVCQAVQHAHQKGVIHRDLKPSNVLVAVHDVTPVVKVIDFGIAKAVGPSLTDKTVYTGFAQMVGTPLYMSPEQAGESSLDVDTRTDVYALGVLLYELLTGTTPIDPDAVRKAGYDELRRIIREDEPARPSARLSTLEAAKLSTVADRRGADARRLARAVRGELDWVVMKCLEKDRGRRYDSAGALAADVQRYLADEPVTACPPGTVYRATKFVRRHRAAVGVGLAVAAAVAVGVGALATTAVLTGRAYESEATHRQAAETAAADADGARREALERADQLRAELYATDLRLAHEAWQHGDLPRLRALLDRHRPGPGVADRRGFEWHYLDAVAAPPGRGLVGCDTPVMAADLSPDGRVAATGDGQGVVKLWDVATGRELRSVRPSVAGVTCVRFSPDGRRLAAGGQDWAVWIFDTETVAQAGRLFGHTGTVTSVAWSPDGRKLVSGGRDGRVNVWNAADGTPIKSLVGMVDEVRAVAWSPDGKLLAAAGREADVRLWTAATGKAAGTLTVSGGGDYLALAFSPNGDQLAAGAYNRPARVWRVATKRLEYQVETGGSSTFRSLAFDPAGWYLMAAAEDGLEVWDVRPPRRRVRVVPGAGAARPVAAARAGGGVLTPGGSEGAARLTTLAALLGYTRQTHPGHWRTACPESGLAVVVEHPEVVSVRRHTDGAAVWPMPDLGGLWTVAFAPGGRRLATTAHDDGVRLWDTTTQRPIRTLAGHPHGAPFLAIAPDGRFVAAGSTRGDLTVWRADTGEVVLTAGQPDGGETRVAFSPDGAVLAVASQTEVALWDTGTWTRRAVLATNHRLDALAFSPDGRTLAGAGYVRGTVMWDVATGGRLVVLGEHAGPHRDATFAPDGRTLATIGADHAVRLWHVPTGRELFTLYRQAAPLAWVRFDTSHRLIVAAHIQTTTHETETYTFPPRP
jgi:WD40 repeat protein/serine/threonine protein kinase